MDHPCAELFFWSLPPNSTALAEKASLFLSVDLIPRDNHISVYKTTIHRAVVKLALFFILSMFVDAPLSAPTFYWRSLTTVMSHYSTTAHTFCTLFMSQINLKMYTNEHIIAKLYCEFKYECIRRWVSNVLATNTWMVGHASILIFLSMCAWWTVVGWKGVGEKTGGGHWFSS